MKQQNITITTYDIDELKPEIQEEVLQRFADINVNYDSWHEDVTEEWEVRLHNMGYKSPSIFWSGFSSQGDGACFIATIDIIKWLKAHKLSNKYRLLFNQAEGISIKITHSSHYYYATSTTVDWEDLYNRDCDTDKLYNQIDEVIELIENERESLGNQIYKELWEWYNALTEEDAIKDTIRANNYEFLEDGSTTISV